MYGGMFVKDGCVTGVELAVSKRSFTIRQTFEGTNPGAIKNAVVGLPVNQFFIKNISLPGALNKKELIDAVNVQIKYHLPYAESTAFTNHHLKSHSRSHSLLITATPQAHYNKPLAVVPETLALYSLAHFRGLLAPGRKCLILYTHEDEAFSVMVNGYEIVFMRHFFRDDLPGELLLCAQAVYLQEERTLLEIDRVILFTETSADETALKGVTAAEILIVKPSEILGGNITKGSEDQFLIPAGLALCGQLFRPFFNSHLKHVRVWNVSPGEIQYRKALAKAVRFTLPVWPLFLTAYFYAELLAYDSRLAGLKGRITALTPRYKEALLLDKEAAMLDEFLKSTGEDLKTPGKWYEKLQLLSSSRPSGLWLTGISGKSAGTVLVSGKSPSYPLVSDYMKKLSASGNFQNLNLIFTQGSDEKAVDFQLSFTSGEETGMAKR